jgi:nucleoside phosphorylase
MLCIKTGMKNEFDVATKHAAPSTLVLTGIQMVEDLERSVPKECEAIMSFGMFGGLRPGAPVVSQTVIASKLIGPDGETYEVDHAWKQRLFEATRFFVQPYYSSGKFNEASTPVQRATIYGRTGAWCVDDESLWVAQFAKARKIPFVIARNCSDQWDQDVSVTSAMLTAKGGVDPLSVLKGIVTSPITMARIAYDYARSQSALEKFAEKIAPGFGWEK